MNRPRIFRKSQRGQFLKWVNLETFELYDFDLYVNHLKSYHTLFTKKPTGRDNIGFCTYLNIYIFLQL